jgi:hypothetical protein
MQENNNIQKIHQILSITGFVTLLALLGFGLYESQNFSRPDPLWNFSDMGVYIYTLFLGAYFILNYFWHGSSFKKELTGGFAIITIGAAVFLTIHCIRLAEDRNDGVVADFLNNLTDALFQLKQPSPQWLRNLMDILPIAVPVLAIICFVLLLLSRKDAALNQTPVPPGGNG